MKKYLLGIDVGTTGTKTLLFSADGQLLGHAYRGYDMYNPQVGYSEQNAEDWWNAVCETVREVCADPEIGKAVAAISLSLQGGTMVAVDKDMQPVRPAMVWNDGRGGPQTEAFIREFGSKIITLHISDYTGDQERHWFPGEGIVNWPEIPKLLKSAGYNGVWMYELSLNGAKSVDRGRPLTFRDFRRNADEIFAGLKPTVIQP